MSGYDSLTRRKTLRLLGAAAATPLLPAIADAARMETFTLYGPPAGPSVTIAHAVATGRLSPIADSADFVAWRNPDELRAGLTSGSIIASVVPAQAAANLYNRGFPIRLTNIMTEGLLYVISGKTDIGAISDLKGLRMAVPFRGDTPEILFSQLLAHAGLSADDLDITYVGTPIEGVQLLLAGRVDAALIAEPAASAAVLKGRQAGKDISRVIDITEAWGSMTGGPPIIPMAGLAVTKAVYEGRPEIIAPLQTALREAVEEVNANPKAAAANATKGLGLPVPVIASSIPHSRLVVRPAADIRPQVEAMYRAMAGPDLARIGGAMPDDAFYL